MTGIQTENRLHGHIAGSLLFLCLAFAGWGAFLYERSSAGERERGMAAQLMRVEAETTRIAGERDQWLAAHGRQQDLERELAETRAQLEAARGELVTLARTQAQDRAELESAKAEVASLNDQLAVANDKASRTSSVTPTKRRLRRSRSK